MKKLHTKNDAEFLIFFLHKMGFSDAKLIGGFGKGKETSEHDIDVLIKILPSPVNMINFSENMKELLDADSFEYTDMKSWYFHNTFFGDVDIFFSTEHFDY